MLVLTDRVYSKNYGYGTVVKVVEGSYPVVTIKLDGLLPWFAEGHIVHCTLDGVRSL